MKKWISIIFMLVLLSGSSYAADNDFLVWDDTTGSIDYAVWDDTAGSMDYALISGTEGSSTLGGLTRKINIYAKILIMGVFE